MLEYIWLETPPKINGLRFAEPVDKPLYKNPCLSFMSEEVNQQVDALSDEDKATPGKYFIKDANETDDVRLFVSKCPDGTIQNVRQSRCEPRPGKELERICKRPDPLTNKSKIQMIEEHLQKLSKG